MPTDERNPASYPTAVPERPAASRKDPAETAPTIYRKTASLMGGGWGGKRLGICALWFSWTLANPATAQWREQTFLLGPGWNSVYLEVDPAPAEADALFSGLPIEAVWTYRNAPRITGSPDCQNPDDEACGPAMAGAWEVWLPASHPHRPTTNLRLIRGGRAYLVRASLATNWKVVGRPNTSATMWRSGLNLVGFSVVEPSEGPPSFETFLAPSPVHQQTEVFEIQADGGLSEINDLGNTPIQSGRGYWVRAGGDAEYDGPVSIDSGTVRGLSFAQSSVDHRMTVENLASAPQSITLTYLASSPVPNEPPELPALAGDVPLRWLNTDVVEPDGSFPWVDLDQQKWSLGTRQTPGSRKVIQIAVHRAALAGAVLDGHGVGAQYQGLLRITDDAGFRRWLSVTAEAPIVGGIAATAGGGGPVGLYAGNVKVQGVSWVTAGARTWENQDPLDPELGAGSAADRFTPRPTPSEFVFPLLLHRDPFGVTKLLNEVTVMWQPGKEPDSPGRYVLVTPECPADVRSGLEPGSVRDGQPFSRRVSTAAYYIVDQEGNPADLVLDGDIGSVLSGQITLPETHPLNPFRHRYHPDHDCDQGGECLEIVRTLTLHFQPDPGPGQTALGWGDSTLGGTYEEELIGLHREPIRVSGEFELRRMALIATLNAAEQ